MFKDKTLLITGGTGSFGNAVLRRFLKTDIAEIRVFSRDEKKQHDMRLYYRNPKLKFYIGDVRRPESLLDAMVSAENVMNAAMAAGVERLVILSTDKSAYPINAMGMTKAIMEKLAVAKSRVAAE